jgi:hypothetical protein
MTELTIKRNDAGHQSGAWSYGQTIALILLLQQFMDFCSTLLEKRAEEKEKREQENLASSTK